MRLPAILLVCSLLGVVAGAFLIGEWAVGCAVIFDSLCAGAWALFHDDGAAPAVAREVPGTALEAIFDRARAS
jgi:hypothetical protein